MKLYIDTNPIQTKGISAAQTFFSVPVELPDKLAKDLLAFEQKIKLYRIYLGKLEAMAQTRAVDIDYSTVEVPEWVETAEAQSEEPPKQQDTEAPSSSKSQSKRKKTQSKSRTSQKKAD